MHESQVSLNEKLKFAASQVAVGTHYAHYKDPSNTYKIIGFGIWEPTDTVSIIYKADYGMQLTFIRPLKVFLETVEFNGVNVPRFSLLDS